MADRGRPRKPLAAHTSHHTKAEIAERMAQEESVACPVTDAGPPDYLTSEADRARFEHFAALLRTVDAQMCTALDADQLARYVIAERQYIKYSKQIDKGQREGMDPYELSKIQGMQNTAFRQVQECTTALGLNTASRFKMDLRKDDGPAPANKYARFEK